MPKITYLDEEEFFCSKKNRRFPVFVVILLLISFILGIGGGIAGLMILSSNQAIKEKLGINLENLSFTNTTQEKLMLEESSKIIEASSKVSPAVVSIITSSNIQDFWGQIYTQEGGGTGIIITNDGLILTNKHVAEAGNSLKVVTSDGKSYDAQKVATDPTNDLAILKINANGLPVVELGDSDNLKVGQWVIAVGNALGELQNTVTAGVISARERQLTAGSGNQTEQLNNLLQTDAAINSGNSGGPLVNLAGQVVGINTAVAGNAQNIGFAIPINQAKTAIDSYKKTGKIIKAQLGVRYVNLTRQIAKQLDLSVDYGALIMAGYGQVAVAPGSPAEKAGFKSGDVILEVNGTRISENKTLGGIINNLSPGDEVTLKYLRDGNESSAKVRLGSTE